MIMKDGEAYLSHRIAKNADEGANSASHHGWDYLRDQMTHWDDRFIVRTQRPTPIDRQSPISQSHSTITVFCAHSGNRPPSSLRYPSLRLCAPEWVHVQAMKSMGDAVRGCKPVLCWKPRENGTRCPHFHGRSVGWWCRFVVAGDYF